VQPCFLLRRSTRGCQKQAALARTQAADKRDSRAPLTAQKLPRHGDGRDSCRHVSPLPLVPFADGGALAGSDPTAILAGAAVG